MAGEVDHLALERARVRLNSCIDTYILEIGGKYIRYPELQESSPCLFRDKVLLNSLGNSFFLHRIQQSFQDFLADDRVVMTPKAGDYGPWLHYAWLALTATTWFILEIKYLAFFTFISSVELQSYLCTYVLNAVYMVYVMIIFTFDFMSPPFFSIHLPLGLGAQWLMMWLKFCSGCPIANCAGSTFTILRELTDWWRDPNFFAWDAQ